MSSLFFDHLASPHVRELPVYQPGKPIDELERELGISGAIKIASNENPLGASPRGVEAAQQAVRDGHWYPDGNAYRLRRALSERLGVAPEEIVFGAGSNEIIHMLIHCLCRPGEDEVLSHRYAFISYRLAALAHNAPFVEADVTPELSCDVDALIAAMNPRTKLVFLANPNNPTGSHVSRKDFERIFAALPPRALLAVDEAYYEYARHASELGEIEYPDSLAYRAAGEPRIFILRTFSKIHGLAGFRVGFGVGDRRVVGLLERVRRPFNVSSMAQAAAVGALDDHEHIARSREVTRAGLAAIAACTRELGLLAYPSLGNFMLVDTGREASDPYDRLLRKGVIVRPMNAWGLPHHVRISVPAPDALDRTLRALREVFA